MVRPSLDQAGTKYTESSVVSCRLNLLATSTMNNWFTKTLGRGFAAPFARSVGLPNALVNTSFKVHAAGVSLVSTRGFPVSAFAGCQPGTASFAFAVADSTRDANTSFSPSGDQLTRRVSVTDPRTRQSGSGRAEEHTSELQS